MNGDEYMTMTIGDYVLNLVMWLYESFELFTLPLLVIISLND
jgi:hypothetical protein